MMTPLYIDGGVQKASAGLFERLHTQTGLNALNFVRHEGSMPKGMVSGFCDGFNDTSAISSGESSNYTHVVGEVHNFPENSPADMVLISIDLKNYLMSATTNHIFICALLEEVEALTLNTDIKFLVTANDTAYTQVMMKPGGLIETGFPIIIGSLHFQKSVTAFKLKITTHNTKKVKLLGYAVTTE
jgi:hypothetical protein